MPFRCINAFSTGGRIVAGGSLVSDDDPILATHAAHFTAVGEATRAAETATSDAPRAANVVPESPKAPSKRPTKAAAKP
ncbi:hypothetical protein [Gordonia malaquae]|uniref:hypothetical protein n=1 Tax=Gordonia malaquae TaxID=410332 RepID=UPI0030FE4E7F